MSDDNPRPDIPDVKWLDEGAYANRVLTDSERREIRIYLAREFGIELPPVEEPEQ